MNIGPQVIAETVGLRLEHREAVDVGLTLTGVRAAGRERHCDVMAGILGRFLDSR